MYSSYIRSLPTNTEVSFKCYYCSDVKTSPEELELLHGVVRVPQDKPENQLLDLDQADPRSLPRTSAAIPSLPSTSAPVRSMPSNSKSVYSTLETQIVQFKTFNCQFCPEKKNSMEELQKHESSLIIMESTVCNTVKKLPTLQLSSHWERGLGLIKAKSLKWRSTNVGTVLK